MFLDWLKISCFHSDCARISHPLRLFSSFCITLLRLCPDVHKYVCFILFILLIFFCQNKWPIICSLDFVNTSPVLPLCSWIYLLCAFILLYNTLWFSLHVFINMLSHVCMHSQMHQAVLMWSAGLPACSPPAPHTSLLELPLFVRFRHSCTHTVQEGFMCHHN